MTSQPVTSAPEVLNSWKEIARYLDRGVRTVQRWEVELALPVRRPHGYGRSAVLALRSELDTWLRTCTKVKPAGAAESGSNTSSINAYYLEALAATAVLIQDSRRLRSDAREARAQLRDAVFQLRQNLGKMMVAHPPAMCSRWTIPEANQTGFHRVRKNSQNAMNAAQAAAASPYLSCQL